MINEIIIDILKRKIKSGEIVVDDIKNADYKAVIEEWRDTMNVETN